MEKIRIGIAGLGRMGKIHAQNLITHSDSCLLVSICSDNPSHITWANQNMTSVKTYTRLEKMLTEEVIDAILICTPSALHPDHFEKSLNKDLHIFCEKPIATESNGIDKVENISRKIISKIIHVGFMRRFDPSYLRAKKLIDSGHIGCPILFRGYSADSIKFIDESLRFAAYSDGQFLDMSIHDIDLMRWFLNSEPIKVTASGGSFIYEAFEKYGDGDNVAAFFQLQNKSMAFIYAGRTAAHGYFVETEIIGTKGSIRIGAQPNADFVELLSRQGKSEIYYQDFEERFKIAFQEEISHFIRCILKNDLDKNNLKDAIEASRISLSAAESFRKNETIILKN